VTVRGCQHVLKGSSSTFQQAAGSAAAAVVLRPSRRRVLKALQALPLQALHLAYETGPSAAYDVPAWASGRPSPLGWWSHQSAAGLIITVTDGEGEKSHRTRDGVRAHDGGRLFCATATSTGLDKASMVLI
jgi:hypothetical protein